MLLKLTNFRNINDRGARVALCAHPLEVTSHCTERRIGNQSYTQLYPPPVGCSPLLAQHIDSYRPYLYGVSSSYSPRTRYSVDRTGQHRVRWWSSLVAASLVLRINSLIVVVSYYLRDPYTVI